MTMIQQKLETLRKDKKGFTLVELIVVIAIIAILTALLVPNFFDFTVTAKQQVADANAKTVFVSAQTYITQSLVDGKNINEIVELTEETGELTSLLGESFTGKYLVTLRGGKLKVAYWTQDDVLLNEDSVSKDGIIIGRYPKSTLGDSIGSSNQ